MLPPSISFNAGDVEARRRIELVDATDLDDVHALRGFNSPGNRLPIEYRTLSIHVESRIPEDTRGGTTSEKRKAAAKGELYGYYFAFVLEVDIINFNRILDSGVAQAHSRRGLDTSGRFPEVWFRWCTSSATSSDIW